MKPPSSEIILRDTRLCFIGVFSTNPPTPHCGKLPWPVDVFKASQGRMPCERGIHPPTPLGIMESRWRGDLLRHGRWVDGEDFWMDKKLHKSTLLKLMVALQNSGWILLLKDKVVVWVFWWNVEILGWEDFLRGIIPGIPIHLATNY